MLRLAIATCVMSLGAFALLIVSGPSLPPPQPIQFSHKHHLDYFLQGRHRQSMVGMHDEAIAKFRDGQHAKSMVALHKTILMKELQDETLVNGLLGDVGKGFCTMCHRGYDSNARNLAKLDECAQCHRRKEPGDKTFVSHMIIDVQNGRCTLCHGDFDKNAGEHVTKLSRCAECHRGFLGHDWTGLADQRPCMGCHSGVLHGESAMLPNTHTCAACHETPLGADPEETKLVAFIEQDRSISWTRIYDYLPSEIVFSHERHAALGHVKCQECHGPVEQSEKPLYMQVKLRMEDCMRCHEEDGANNDCLACHR